MPYAIEEQDGRFEIQLWGATSKWEVLEIVYQLYRRDPRKRRGDLWFIRQSDAIPFVAYPEIVEAVQRLGASLETTGARSAVVTDDALQRAQLEMFRSAASGLPFEIGVFATREEAVRWLAAPAAPPASSAAESPHAAPEMGAPPA